MIDRDHPAVEAMLWHEGQYNYAEPPENWPERLRNAEAADYADKIEHALPRLESSTPENITRLRNTPAGRALLAEGWDRGAADNERVWIHVYDGHDVDPDDPWAMCLTCNTPNPYREETE